jgi:hypothetical protein
MKMYVLIAMLIVQVPSALAGELQFGVIYASDYKAGSPLQPGNGYGIQTFVVANLGTVDINLADLSFTSSLVFTTTSVNPVVAVQNTIANRLLAPGQAYGYINGDFNQTLTVAYVQSIFPTTTDLIIDSNGLEAAFGNPLGSGVIFQNSETLVDYQLSIDGATAAWQTRPC